MRGFRAFCTFLLAFALCGLPSTAAFAADRKNATTEPDAGHAKHVTIDFPDDATPHEKILMLAAIARDTLEDERIGTAERGNNAVLALWDPDSPEDGLRIVHVLDGKSVTEGYQIELRPRNESGPRYRVVPDDLQVLAIRHNVIARTWVTVRHKTQWIKPKPKRSKKTGKMVEQKKVAIKVKIETEHHETEPAVHVTYLPILATPEMIADGETYLRDLALWGRYVALHSGLRSRVYPDRNITDVIPALAPLVTLINEHTDHNEFFTKGVEMTTEKVFTVTALNGEHTYGHSRSSAEARGFAQFIRSSYDYTVKGCPEAKLIKDFKKGMRNHLNAVLAQYCYMDATLAMLTEEQRQWLLRPEHEEWLVAYLAAAYNGSPARAAKTYTRNKAKWETIACTPQPMSKGRRKKVIPDCLAPETKIYMQKMHAIYDLLKSKNLQGF